MIVSLFVVTNINVLNAFSSAGALLKLMVKRSGEIISTSSFGELYNNVLTIRLLFIFHIFFRVQILHIPLDCYPENVFFVSICLNSQDDSFM